MSASNLRNLGMDNELPNSGQSRRENATSPAITGATPGPGFLGSSRAAGIQEKTNAGTSPDREAALQINDFEKLQSAYANQASLFDERSDRDRTRKQQSQWATIYDAIKLNPRWQKMQQCITQVKENRE